MRVFKPTVGGTGPMAGSRELEEMREAIIHCDGSPEMMKHLSGLLAQDLPALESHHHGRRLQRRQAPPS